MNLYDKIWIPEKTQGMAFRDKEGDTPSIVSGPVIVLSIEEALDIWKAGMKRATEIAKMAIREEEGNPDAPDFKTYLQSKGISI